jgi:hypothetical protein
MLERTHAITNDVLEPITFVLAYPTAVHEKSPLRFSTATDGRTDIRKDRLVRIEASMHIGHVRISLRSDCI